MDTSVWIDFFKNRQNSKVQKLTGFFLKDEDICLCGIILTEVLQGIVSDKEYMTVKKVFQNLIVLPIGLDTYVNAAGIYRLGRQKGYTIRNSIDCLIAACAVEHGARLLENDKDYEVIAKFTNLKLL